VPTGLDLVKASMRAIGALAAGETPRADEAEDCRTILNRMIDGLNIQQQWMYEQVRTAVSLTSGVRDYTIGTGGTINIARPTVIAAAGFVQDSTASTPIEIPIEVFTDQRWQEIAQKTLAAGVLWGIYFDRAFSQTTQRGTISTYPTINVSNAQVVLYTPGRPVAKFTNLTTNYYLAEGYEEALHYNLCVRLAPEFERPINAKLEQLAERSLSWVKAANYRAVEVTLDRALPGLGPGTWSIDTGSYRR